MILRWKRKKRSYCCLHSSLPWQPRCPPEGLPPPQHRTPTKEVCALAPGSMPFQAPVGAPSDGLLEKSKRWAFLFNIWRWLIYRPKLLNHFLDEEAEAHRELRSIRKNEQEYKPEKKNTPTLENHTGDTRKVQL